MKRHGQLASRQVVLALLVMGSIAISGSSTNIRAEGRDADIQIIVHHSDELEVPLWAALVEPTQEEDIQSRVGALHKLSGNQQLTRKLLPVLLADARSEHADIRRASIQAIPRADDRLAAVVIEDCLRTCLTDEDPGVRYAATSALARQTAITEETAELLLQRLSDPDPNVSHAVMSFLIRCPKLQRRSQPRLIELLDSAAQRATMISKDFFGSEPLAWDAARMIAMTYDSDDRQTKSALEKKLVSSDDSRLRFILSSILDQEVEGDGLVMTLTRHVARNGSEYERRQIVEEIVRADFSIHVRFRLLKEMCKGTGRASLESGVEIVDKIAYWPVLREELAITADDEEIPDWLRSLIREWLLHNPE